MPTPLSIDKPSFSCYNNCVIAQKYSFLFVQVYKSADSSKNFPKKCYDPGVNRNYIVKGGKSMKDEKIVEMFLARDENAIRETEAKYGDFCHYIMRNYLSSREDREECINDSMLVLWNSIPPEEPKSLFAYLSRIVRNLALARSRSNCAWKRGGQVQIVNDEILMLMDDGTDLASDYEAKRAGDVINAFLERASKRERAIFVMRYWHNESYPQICARMGLTEGNVKMILSRMRKKLKEELGKEGIII